MPDKTLGELAVGDVLTGVGGRDGIPAFTVPDGEGVVAAMRPPLIDGDVLIETTTGRQMGGKPWLPVTTRN